MKCVGDRWRVRDKGRLLTAIAEKLGKAANLSLEGNLRNSGFARAIDTSSEETTVLKRNTTWPRQDFAILPLEPSIVQEVLRVGGGTIPRNILHIQVEKGGVLEFGAYDGFDPECIVFGSTLDDAFLDAMISEGVIERK